MKEKSPAILRAEENLAEVTAKAIEVLRICEYVEESREKNPDPQVLVERRENLARRESRFDIELHENYLKADEMIIRILASSSKPIKPDTVIKAFEILGLQEGLGQHFAKESIWRLVYQGPVEFTEGSFLTLSLGVREQFT